MTDRELLDMAAKAAGIKIEWGEVFNIGDCEVDCTDLAFADDSSPDDAAPSVWNPRTDYADGLLLAVKLELIVDTLHDRAMPSRRHDLGHRDWTYGDDVLDAIVKCAAEIGRNMP